MNCPACENQLSEREAGGIKVDVCRACGGIWFDNFELMKVDAPHDSAGEELLDIAGDGTVELDHERDRSCPSCDDMLLLRHFFSPLKRVEVDECPGCGGVWLDVGELAAVRTQSADEENRKQAAEDYFDEVFGAQLGAMREESEEKAEKARKFARIFRFICPSYYIPGKQKWGAF